MIDRKELKSNAREAMSQTRPHPFWVTLGVAAILTVVQVLSLSLNGELDAYRAMYENALAGTITYVEASGSGGFFSWLLTLALDVMSMVVAVGYALYSLRLIRRQSPGFGDVFDAFGLFLRAVAVRILKAILILLWSLLFMLPVYLFMMIVLVSTGVAESGTVDVAAESALELVTSGGTALVVLTVLAFVMELVGMLLASYRYRLAEFILLDHPEFTAGQCLSLSRMAMKGRKWELFKLDVSFLGWFLLSLIPFVGLWVRAYHSAASAGWYERSFPAFMEEFKTMWQERQSRFSGPRNQGGWSVPGQNDEDDGPDDRWM